MMQFNKALCSLALIGVFFLSACSKDVVPGDYDAAEVGKVKKVVPGVIVSVRPVRLHNKNEMGMSDAAAPVDAAVTGSHGFEYVIKLNSGGIISVVQADKNQLKAKQSILVIYGRNTRVVADNGSENF